MRATLDAASVKESINVIAFYRSELPGFAPRASFGWQDGGALCPFHDDRRAGSFRINCESGRFKCFSCGASGDAIEFAMRRHGLTFRSALEYLREFSA